MKIDFAKAKAFARCAGCAAMLAACAAPPPAPAPAAIEPRPAPLPLITNAPMVAAVEPAPGFDAQRVDELASAAAAQAVVDLKCAPDDFQNRARAIGKHLNAQVRKQGGVAAARYAKDSAVISYRRLARHNAGLGCAQMEPLRKVARAEGFGQAPKPKKAKAGSKSKAKGPAAR